MFKLLFISLCLSSELGVTFSLNRIQVPSISSIVAEGIKNAVSVANDTKHAIGETVEKGVLSVMKYLNDIPLSIAQGMMGSGDWLRGIVDDVDAHNTNRTSSLKLLGDEILKYNEDATLKFPELANKYGYPAENYSVETEDGYILMIFRIPHGIHNPLQPGERRPVVFIQHGLIESSDDWIIMGPEKSLGYILADAGYDVWFGNARGNTYSRRHASLNPCCKPFWEFSWDEIGRYDLPAMIDYILASTEQVDLYYVGHSQGTTAFFVMCSMRPEYNSKIRLMIALAPVAWMSNMVSPFVRLLSPASGALGWVLDALGVGEFLPSSKLIAIAGGILCHQRALTRHICTNSIFIVCGFDISQLNVSMLPVIMGHVPAGASVRQFLHYAQGLVSKDFRRFDFGFFTNKKMYGKRVPPSYNMSAVTAPVMLFYSLNDWLSHPKDVDILRERLDNVVEVYLVPHDKFNHMDYLWAIDVYTLVYEKILDSFKNYG